MPLEENGLPELTMARPPEMVDPPAGVSLHLVEDGGMRLDFLRVNAAGWGMGGVSDLDAAAMFSSPAPWARRSRRSSPIKTTGRYQRPCRSCTKGLWAATEARQSPKRASKSSATLWC